MKTSGMKKVTKTVCQKFSFAALLTGCVYGENQQFFQDKIETLGGEEILIVGGVDPQVDPAPTATPNPALYTDSYAVQAGATPKIDVLFCVDNSGSMADNQNTLASSFSGFINGFINAGVDFHIGIVTSDVATSSASYWNNKMPAYVSPNRGNILSRYSSDIYLKNSSSSLVSKFEQNAKVGTNGDGSEQCLQSFSYAMDAAHLAGPNAGFFRNDSLLSFVIVSDENEDIRNGETIEARVQRIKDRIAEISGVASRGFSFKFIINKNVAAPATTPAPGYPQYYPARYLAAANLLAGQTYDIGQNFSNDLLTISSGLVAQAQSEFTLSELPQGGVISQVILGGVVVNADATNGYVYHASRNTIELKGSALATAPGKTLSVSYIH